MLKKRLILSFLIGFILQSCTTKKSPEPFVKPLSSCEELIKGLPADYVHGWVTVPEDYEAPNAKKIKVFYYGRVGDDSHPSIVFFNGGPAADGHSLYQNFEQIFDRSKEARPYYPMMFIDQRGTGCSDHYAELESESDVTEEDLISLSHYASKEIVLDAEEIRKKLGIQKWKVFGQSFGAQIGMRYLEVAPKGIRSLHLHGYSTLNDPLDFLVGRILSQKRLSEEYFGKYPEDLEIYKKIERYVSGDDICLSVSTSELCGYEILHPLTQFLGFTIHWSYLHEVLQKSIVDGQIDLKELRAVAIQEGGGGDSSNPYASAVITWVERGVPGFNYDVCKRIYDRIRKNGQDPDQWRFNECLSSIKLGRSAPAEFYDMFKKIPTNILTTEKFKNSVLENKEIPIFLYSGAKDSFSPTEGFKEIVEALGSKIYYKNFPDSGHEGFFSESEIWKSLYTEKPPEK